MAQLRAKQIKLVSAGDLLVGGANGNGAVLSMGADKTVLKVVNGGLAYVQQAAADVAFDGGESTLVATDTNAAIIEVDGKVVAAQAEIDAIELGAGLEADGSYLAQGVYDADTNATGAHYIGAATSLKMADAILDAALKGLADTVATHSTGLTNLQKELDDSQAALGLNVDGTLAAFAAGGYAEGKTTFKEAIEAIDAALKLEETARADEDAAINLRIDNLDATQVAFDNEAFTAKNVQNAILEVNSKVKSLGNAFNYVGALTLGADEENAFDLDTLPADEKDPGDYFKVTTAGFFKYTDKDDAEVVVHANVNDGLVKNIDGGWDVIDNTNSTVAGTAGEIVVTGSTETGFTVSLDQDYKGQISIDTLGTITTGTWEGDVVGIEFGGTGLSTVGAEHTVLTVNADGSLEYVMPSALRNADGSVAVEVVGGKLVASVATAEGDSGLTFTTKGYVDAAVDAAVQGAAVEHAAEDFEVAETAVNAVFTLANEAIGAIGVYFNGVKLRKTAYTLGADKKTITLVDSVIGYSVDAGDVINVDYEYNKTVAAA